MRDAHERTIADAVLACFANTPAPQLKLAVAASYPALWSKAYAVIFHPAFTLTHLRGDG